MYGLHATLYFNRIFKTFKTKTKGISNLCDSLKKHWNLLKQNKSKKKTKIFHSNDRL